MQYFHLTTPQQNIWNLQKYYEDSAVANLCGAVFYKEKRNSGLLQQAICQFIKNQSGMRLRFLEDMEAKQYVSDGMEEAVPVMAFSSREEFDRYAEEFAKEPIGLTNRAMYRFVAFHIKDTSGILVVLSHLIADAWTFGMLANQLEEAYQNLTGQNGNILLKADYTDFIRSEDEYFLSDRYEKDKKYWEEKYSVRPEESAVKLCPASSDSIEAKRITRALPLSLERKINAYCKTNPVTPAVLFETALVIYLSKINPENRSVTIGVPILNRSNVREKRIAGMFVSTMPLTVELTEAMAVSELAKQITREHKDIFRHQKYPYANILKYLREKQNFSGNLYDVMFSYQNAKTHTGADTRWYSNGYSEVPFIINIDNRDEKDSHTINVDYQTAVFGEEEAGLLIGRLEYILEQITADDTELIGNINIVPERELEKVVYDFNDTYVDYPRDKCVHELFSEQVQKTPDKIALVFEDKKFTYRQLDEMSNSLAHFLREKGVKPNDVVPIIAKRSWHVVVAMLGVLKAGGAYTLIDYQYPMERILHLVHECKCDMAFVYGCKLVGQNCIDLKDVDYGKNVERLENINNPQDALCAIHTSGSTGVPKLTVLTHRSIMHYIDYSAEIFSGIEQAIAATIITFDAFIQETLVALCRNIPVVLLNDVQITNPSEFENIVSQYNDSFLFQTPTKLLSYIRNVESKGFLTRVRNYIIGGEVFPYELYDVLNTHNLGGNIFNIYGPTETTVCVSVQKLKRGDDITIGKPIANTQIYILGKDSNPLPIGVAGELCIAGDGVGKGYLNQPGLTAERFVPNPLATEENRHGKIMYRTGDLARWRSDGEIEYLGRMDTQVKIRGLRIELGEIESVMGSMEGIGLAAVADKRDGDNRQYLVGYYTADTEMDEKKLRQHLSAKLPKYMIPNYFMHLDAMPMTASGKIDRKNLPLPDFTRQTKEYAEPETDTEKRLAGIWQQLLHVEKAGKSDDFFELGGDSLLAISMLNEIETEFHVEISVKDIMECTLLEQLAQCIAQAHPAKRITARHEKKYVLLPQQKAIYAACSKNPDALTYHMPARVALPDGIDKNKLKQSIRQALDYHKALKSRIVAAGNEIYGVYDSGAQIEFEEYRSGEETGFVRPFDLGKAPLIRVGFTGDALLFDMHHIVADGDSLSILLRDIASLYHGETMHEPGVEYSDYAKYFYGLDMAEHRQYFIGMLNCDFEPVSLPETKGKGQGGKSKLYLIPEKIFSLAKDFGRRNGFTDTMVFLGAYGILLSKYTAKKEILSSVILQNRTHAETKGMVGMFVNTLPVHIAVKSTMPEYMEGIKQLMLNLFRYQELPFWEIANAVGIDDKSVVNTSFVFQGDGEKTLALNDQKLVPQYIDTHTAKFDFSMELTPLEEGCRIRLEYSLEKFDGKRMDELADAYIRILLQLDKEKVSDIRVLPGSEYRKIVEGFNDTYMDYPRDKCVHELFSGQAQKTPDKTALVFEGRKFTYRQLDEMSNSLAHFLWEKGVGPNDVVPIIAKRSWHVVVAMLGVLKTGGAYMPVAPDYPENRIRYMLETVESGLALLYGYNKPLSIEQIDLNGFDYCCNIEPLENRNLPEDLCYVLYTSGTTGNPKGIEISHRNLVNFMADNPKNEYQHYAAGNGSIMLALTTFTFDISVFELYLSLLNGLSIVMANEDEMNSPCLIDGLIGKYAVDILHCTPTKLAMLLNNDIFRDALKAIKVIMVGAEELTSEFYHKISACTDAVIFNGYGPTEITIGASFKKMEDESDITIGKPIANTQIYILDKDSNPLPIGVAGELCIAGDGVGKGYLNQPGLTAERFVPNPFATEENRHGKVMYRTGDLARWRPDGEIEYLGRMDTQVKIRGLRIELGEIESVMGSMEGIGLAAVADKRDGDNRQYLVGYYTADTEMDEKKLRQLLSAKLPKYMVPNYFMHLEAMPMTASGKIDRKNLPLPDFTRQTKEYAEPETDTEKRLAGIWQGLLHVEKVGKSDDFFELGGDSLLAISMLNEIETEFHVEISMKDIMEQTLLEQLAQCIAQAHPVKRMTARHEKKYVLLPQQKAIYAACGKNPGTLVYNMPARIELPEKVDRVKLRQGIRRAISPHRILASYIRAEEDEVYGVYDEGAEIEFEEYGRGEEGTFVRPFDLGKAPLARIGFTEDALLFDANHIIADGDSVSILLRSIVDAYQGKALPEPDVEYSDYAGYFYGLDMAEGRAYFKKMLDCDFDPVQLPETKSRGRGGRSKLYLIPEEIFLRAKDFARKSGLTDTMVFLGAYGILLSKYTAKKEILSSIILQNRTHAETRGTVGMFVNTLPIHLSVKGTVAEYMEEVKQLLRNLFQYQELPFWEIANAVGMDDKSAVNTSFIYQGDGEKALEVNGRKLVSQFIDTHTAKFDFSMELTPLGEGCRIRLEYSLAKFDEKRMDELADAYIRILPQLDKEKVSDIRVLPENEYRKIVEGFNDTYVDYPRDKCVHELFSGQAQKTPDKTALVFEDRKFTYRQLDEMSNSLAHFLRGKGVGSNDVVPIIAKRSWHVVVAMLGVLKAGGAYMPVAPDYPADRISYMMEMAGCKIALVYGYEKKLDIEPVKLGSFDFAYKEAPIENRNCPENLAYIIFTSGSTGMPKGVSACHRNVCNYVHNNDRNSVCHKIVENRYESIVSVTNIVFDIFVTESILPLLNGLCVYFASDEEAASQDKLSGLVGRNHIDVLQTTPTKMKSYILDRNNVGYLRGIKAIILGGEAFPQDLYHELKSHTDAQIFNIYGPAETTVWSTNAKVMGDDITIGKPIANTQIYILDKDNNPLPIGAAGELCIAGDSVGKGYLNQPELTAERFVPNPFATEENRHGKVMYRTGDLARWRPDGEIEYLGRIDTQVKIRGLRIELGEIESVMGSMEGIGLTAVADKRDGDNRQYLVGYYTADTEMDEKKLRQHLSAKLPKYMVPNYFMHLEAMPMTASGKIARKNLPIPDFSAQNTEYAAPATEKERKLCQLLEGLLHMERVGTGDDFFEMGGDSLTAIEYTAKAHGIGIDFALQNVFDYPTVQALCGFLEKGDAEKVHYQFSDFAKYQELLERNKIEESFVPKKKCLGNILLTGATGFLGAHVLDSFMKGETGKIYCLVRGKTEEDCKERLLSVLRYYFGDRYSAEMGKRVIPVMGDIEGDGLALGLPTDVQAVIHTAASVRHYGSYDYFRRINVEGTRHVINYAKSLGAKLIHISTLSVSGNSMADDFTVYRSEEEKYFYETSLYIGQPLDNVYVHSKFEAEKAVYDAMLGGLDAKVIRVGNLTNRVSDYKFQPNYKENAFLTRAKAALEFGLFPDYLMPLYSEFSPVDLTAEGIVRIAQYAGSQCVFHLNSNRPIYFDRFLEVVRELGVSMEVVDGDTFNRELHKTLLNTGTEYIFEAFQNDMDGQGRLIYDSNIHIVNDFTVWFLKKVGFEWNETDMEYIKGYIEYFRGIGYLKV